MVTKDRFLEYDEVYKKDLAKGKGRERWGNWHAGYTRVGGHELRRRYESHLKEWCSKICCHLCSQRGRLDVVTSAEVRALCSSKTLDLFKSLTQTWRLGHSLL